MSLIALSSDWHLHSYQGPMVRTLANGTNSRLQDILDCAEWMVTDALSKGATAFLHGGDLTHNRKQMANEAWTRVAQFMRVMGQRIPTYVMEGNHDLSASGDGTSTVGALDGFVTAVPRSCVLEIGGAKVGWLPYTENPDEVRSGVDKLSRKGATVLIAHLGIGDPKFAHCVPADYEVPGRINVQDLLPDRFAQVFLGHYHTAHEILPNMRYMGSPLQLSFAETGKMKGYWLIDTKTMVAEFVENTRSPSFHIMSGADAVARLAAQQRGEMLDFELSGRDFLWVKDATREEATVLSEAHGDGVTPALRLDRARVTKDITVRVDPTSPVGQQLDQYVRHVAPATDDSERAALVIAGDKLLKEAIG